MTDPNTPAMPAGWYQDPTGVGDARYWDGSNWTESISTRGITMTGPIEPDRASVPPVPGTEFTAAAPTPAPAPAYVPPPAAPAPAPQRSSAGLIGIIVVIGIALIAIIVVIASSGDDDGEDEPPATTEAPPPETEPPAEGNGGDEGG